MRKYNFTRPLMIIAVAFLVKSLTTSVCLLLGTSEATASNIAFGAMVLAALLVFLKVNPKNKR